MLRLLRRLRLLRPLRTGPVAAPPAGSPVAYRSADGLYFRTTDGVYYGVPS